MFPGLVTSTKKFGSPAGEVSFKTKPEKLLGSGGVSVPSRVAAKEVEVLPEEGWSEIARILFPF